MSDRAGAGWGRVALSWGLAILLAILAVYAALARATGAHAYDTAAFHVYRSVGFSGARVDGRLSLRWVQAVNAELGEPLFSFSPPLLYLLVGLLGRIGVAQTLAWRLLVAPAFLALAAGTFKLALALSKRADVVLVCTAAVTYAPYLVQELCERGSPQGLAIALYPWLP